MTSSLRTDHCLATGSPALVGDPPSPESLSLDNKIGDDLVRAQFSQLIDSIKSTRERIHQIAISAIIGLPATIFLAKAFQESFLGVAANIIVIISPFLITAFAMFYASERAAIKRYGSYIKMFIDPLMLSRARPDFVGWSTAIKENARFAPLIEQTSDYDTCKTTGMLLLICVYLISAVAASGSTLSGLVVSSPIHFYTVVFCVVEVAAVCALWKYRVWLHERLDVFNV